jgi:dephospho-CoA kinase
MNNKTKIIGLTGGIGSGKSSVLQLFKNKGIPVYVADIEAKLLMQNEPQIIHKIKALFGNNSYENGKLNRSYLAAEVFTDPEKLKLINAIVHPHVQSHFKKFLTLVDSPFVIYENAILFENGFDKMCEYIILVTAPIDLRIQRVIRRDGCSEQQVLERMQNQWTDDLKKPASHYIIDNVDWEQTEIAVEKIYEELLYKFQRSVIDEIELDFEEF